MGMNHGLGYTRSTADPVGQGKSASDTARTIGSATLALLGLVANLLDDQVEPAGQVAVQPLVVEGRGECIRAAIGIEDLHILPVSLGEPFRAHDAEVCHGASLEL